jgi:hypothetical protein
MAAIQDPKLRPVYADRLNQRLFADPVGAGRWPEVQIGYGSLPALSAYVVLGRGVTGGTPQPLSADVTIALLNTATSAVIDAARVTAGSTTSAGVLQLTDSVSSTSTTTAATPAAVKSAYDLAGTAQTLAAAALAPADIGVSVQGYNADTAFTDVVQTFTVAQRGAVQGLGTVAAGTLTLDFNAANHFALTLPAGGTVTLANPSNQAAGQSGCVVITQNGATAATVAFGSHWRFEGGAPSVSTVLDSVNLLVYYAESATRITAELKANTTS